MSVKSIVDIKMQTHNARTHACIRSTAGNVTRPSFYGNFSKKIYSTRKYYPRMRFLLNQLVSSICGQTEKKSKNACDNSELKKKTTKDSPQNRVERNRHFHLLFSFLCISFFLSLYFSAIDSLAWLISK